MTPAVAPLTGAVPATPSALNAAPKLASGVSCTDTSVAVRGHAVPHDPNLRVRDYIAEADLARFVAEAAR